MEKPIVISRRPLSWAATALSPTIPTSPDVSVVLVCWNNKSYLKPCLDSLYAATITCHFEVVVVDNGSTDGSQRLLREDYPQVQLIQNTDNVGLGRASNQGIAATTGRYVLLLNNDTVVKHAALDDMVAFLDTIPQAGAVGGRIFNPDGSVQTCYNNFSTLAEEFLIATRLGGLLAAGYPAIIHDDEVRAVGWISSACLMLRRAALDEIGLLDEEYFIYGDEADLQYRLKQAGWQVYYLPCDAIIHYGGRSMNRWSRRKMVYRGKILFYQKHYGFLRTALLRTLLGMLSLGKLCCWGIVSLLPAWHDQAQKEVNSNIDVVKLCYKVE